MTNTTIVRHLTALAAHLEENDFSTKPQDKAVRAAIALLKAPGEAELQARLRELLDGYREVVGTTVQGAIRDALTDLRHICDAESLDFSGIARDAHQVYLEELRARWRQA